MCTDLELRLEQGDVALLVVKLLGPQAAAPRVDGVTLLNKKHKFPHVHSQCVPRIPISKIGSRAM